MSKIKIPKNTVAPYVVDADDNTYIVEKGVKLNATDTDLIFEASTSSANTFQIAGTLNSNGSGYAFYSAGYLTTLDIEKTGKITSDSIAVVLEGIDQSVTNAGVINAETYGIQALKSFVSILNKGDIIVGDDGTGIYIDTDQTGQFDKVVNDGKIEGHRGIYWQESQQTLTLGKHSDIKVDEIAIYRDNATGNSCDTVNSGKINAATAFYGGDGDDTFVNRGKIDATMAFNGGNGDDTFVNMGKVSGEVYLGAGNDTFVTSDGDFKGKVRGSAGDDIYIINSAKIDVLEVGDGGNDAVYSSVSYKLSDMGQIEKLYLIGEANINATGDGIGNEILGNKGNNILSGLFGDDTLSGGGGSDVFVMTTNSGTDQVTDFTDGKDRIDVRGWTGIDSFADITSHITVDGDSVKIIVNTDTLILLDTQLAELSAKDFMF